MRFFCFGRSDRKPKTTSNGNEDQEFDSKASRAVLDSFDAFAEPQDKQQQSKRSDSFDVDIFKPPPYSKDPPNHTSDQQPSKQPAVTPLDKIPPEVRMILKLWRKANKLDFFGHSGAWSAYRNRHGNVWLDSSHLLDPMTCTAILLKAAEPLLIGTALNCDMTFFFTTLPNVESEELTDTQRETLKALMEVFKSPTFLGACKVIHTHKLALQGEGMQEFLDAKDSFDAEDMNEQKLVKLLNYTRERMARYWYGWHIRELTFKNLRKLYKKAQRWSDAQPKLLNNNAFVYRREIGNYKRLLNSAESYLLTCTFLLATPISPKEVQLIQNCQLEGQKVLQQVTERMFSLKGLSMITKTTYEDSDAQGESENNVAQELEKQGHPFCIQAAVFADKLGKQDKDCYDQVDNFLQGRPDDVNDVTFLSQLQFLEHLLHENWTMKITTSCDPRIDDSWAELRTTPKYNKEKVAPEDNKIKLPTVPLIRRYVFDIVEDEDYDEDDEDAEIGLRGQGKNTKIVAGEDETSPDLKDSGSGGQEGPRRAVENGPLITVTPVKEPILEKTPDTKDPFEF
jgi:hypothetical protein